MKDTYYEVFGVSRNIIIHELKKKYKELILKHHPDKNNGIELEKFIQVNEAWKVLSDSEARRKYDAQLFWKEREQVFINEKIPLEDLKFDNDDDEYLHECRCGGDYVIPFSNDEEVRDSVVQCSSCTLFIQIC